MRTKCFYSILLFLFCSVPVTAQRVAFEGLHLDNLIPGPGERKPGSPDFRFEEVHIPGLSRSERKDWFSGCALKEVIHGKYPIYFKDVNDDYFRNLPADNLTDKLALHIRTNRLTDGYRSLNRLYSAGVGMELNYKISKTIELKGGVCYQYNVALKRWEWACLTGVIFHF